MSPREEEVFRFLGAGLMNKEIAWELGIGEATVKALVSAVLRKVGATSRSQAALLAHNIPLAEELDKARAAARIERTPSPLSLPAAGARARGLDMRRNGGETARMGRPIASAGPWRTPRR